MRINFQSIKTIVISAALLGAAFSVSCGFGEEERIAVDGSSTVFPITEAVAEEFRAEAPNININVGISGTGGGFQRLCRGGIEIANASRPIKESESEECRQNNIEYIELPVAYDGISVVVNPANDWASSITVAELKKLWEPEAQEQIRRWNQVNPEWPDEEIHLFGPGVDSGTYDYLTQAIVGEEGASRGDFTSSEDDNVLVQGVAADQYALGFFGYAYYEENKDKLKVLAIDDGNPENGTEVVAPTRESISEGTYQPLSRPMFIYVRRDAADQPAVKRFIDFYLQSAPQLVGAVGYVALPQESYQLVEERFQNRVTGSVFEGGGSQVGVSVEDLLKD
ncbi:MAG: PstS family phosphate ABC transporter substrate-binding protein [Acidobacteriota bacterium]